VLLIPHAVQHLVPYMIAIVAGTLVTAAALWIVKKPLAEMEPAHAFEVVPAVAVKH